jgi:hypothetical protein
MTDGRTVTFRIDGEVISIVEQESHRLNINLNNMVNQILKGYVDWDMLQARAGMIPIAKPLLIELLKKVSDEEVVTLATKVGKDTMKDIVSFMKGRMDRESFLTWVELWLRKNSTAGFSHNIDYSTNIHTYIMKHDLGEKWSLYHKLILDLVFKETLQKPLINLTSSEMLITFSFKE